MSWTEAWIEQCRRAREAMKSQKRERESRMLELLRQGVCALLLELAKRVCLLEIVAAIARLCSQGQIERH